MFGIARRAVAAPVSPVRIVVRLTQQIEWLTKAFSNRSAARRQRIDVRRLDDVVAVAAERAGRLVVGKERRRCSAARQLARVPTTTNRSNSTGRIVFMAAELIGCSFHKLSEHTVSVHENREPSRLAKSWRRHQDSNAPEFDMVNARENCCIRSPKSLQTGSSPRPHEC